MEPSDVAALRETWAAACHADAPKGACCCCYRSHHHQHQVRTEAAEAEVERLRAKLERVARASIEEITFSDDDRVVLSCRLCGSSNRWRQSEAAWHAPDCVLAE